MTESELFGRSKACIEINIKNLENLDKNIKGLENTEIEDIESINNFIYFIQENADDLEQSMSRLMNYIKEIKKSLND